MGVTSLGQLIKNECPSASVPIDSNNLELFRGKTLAWDVSGLMHRFVNACNSIANDEHLHSFVGLWRKTTAAGIESCFVFDGKQTNAKADEITKRVHQRDKRMSKAKAQIVK